MAGSLRLGPVVLHDVREIFLKSSAGHLEKFLIKKKENFLCRQNSNFFNASTVSTMDPIPNEG